MRFVLGANTPQIMKVIVIDGFGCCAVVREALFFCKMYQNFLLMVYSESVCEGFLCGFCGAVRVFFNG